MHHVGRLGALTVLGLIGHCALAADELIEQHAAHEHGSVTLDVALDGEYLLVALEAPAINVIEMERAPRDDAERARVSERENWLRTGAGAFGVPRAAACRRESVQLESPRFTPRAVADGDAGHGDYRVQFRYRCSHPAALAWLECWLLDRLTGVEAVTVNILAPGLQTTVSVLRGRERIALR